MRRTRSVIKDEKTRAEVGHECEQRGDGPGEFLRAMVQVGNGEVGRKYGHRIAEDQVVLPVEYAFLFFGQVGGAKKAGPLGHALFPHVGKGALDSSRVVLDTDGKSAAL